MKRLIVFLLTMTWLALETQGLAKTTLLVSRWESSPAQDLVDKRFIELNPDIEIEVLGQKGGLQLAEAGGEGLVVQLVGGVIPDVAVMADATIGKFAAAGALTDLTSLLTQGGYFDHFWPAAWNAVRLNGRFWGVPYVTDTRALNYNTDIFARAGFSQPPQSLQELDQMAAKMTIAGADGSYKQFGFWPRWGNWWLWGWGWLFGGSFYDDARGRITANDPRIVEALEYEVSYVRRYQRPSGSFCAGTLAMQIDVSTAMPYYKKSCPNLMYRTAPVPPPEGRTTTTWSGIWVWAIPKGAPHPEAAWRYLQFLMSPEAQRIKAIASGEIPTNLRATRDLIKAYEEAYGESGRVYLDLTSVTNVRPVIPISNEYWNELEAARDRAYKLQTTPQAALDEVTRILQAKLEESRRR